MSQIQELQPAIRGVVHLCIHCSSKAAGTGKYCDECKTAAGRKEQCDMNNKLLLKTNNKFFICPTGEHNKDQK